MKKLRRWIENLLLVAGLIAIDVWIWSHAAAVIYQCWENRAFDEALAVPEAPSAPVAPSAPAPATTKTTGARVGRLTIPRLHLRAMVREGTGEDTLSLALGHIPNTALPGQIGNVGIAGHRDTIFRSLRDIRRDDLIVFETAAGKYTYRVQSTAIVNPEKVSVLNPGRFPELTLVTCYPFRYIGSAPDRFIVKARGTVAPAPRASRGPSSRWHARANQVAWRGFRR